jgi:hypothetical protein
MKTTYIHNRKEYAMSKDMIFYYSIAFDKTFSVEDRRQAIKEYNKALDINNAIIDKVGNND